MNSKLLTRIALILSFGGIFVSAVLAIAHTLGRDVPCGGSGGCRDVALHPSSRMLFGIDNAYLGMAAYAVLACLAAIRLLKPSNSRLNLGLAYAICIGGTLFSGYLTYLEYSVIHAFCLWCIASAIIITLLLLVHAAEFQAVSDGNAAAGGPSTRFDFGLIVGGVALTALASGVSPTLLHDKILLTMAPITRAQFDEFPLVPPGANIYGNAKAPVTIVEFADLQCPGCRSEFPKMKDLIARYNGKVRLVFRHFPITNEHPLALPAAALAEYAATKGKFFDYVTAVYAADPESLKTADDLLKIVDKIGLNSGEAKAEVMDENSAAFARVSRDVQAKDVYGLIYTPTFLVYTGGNDHKPDVALAADVEDVLKKEKYQKAMGYAGS